MTYIKKLIFLICAIALLTSCNKVGANKEGWVINEVLVDNQTANIDEFGERSGWVELFNNSAKTQNLAGCFITDDPSNPKKYPIPLGDVLTQVRPHQSVILYMDAEPFRGTFHTSFKLDPSKENYLALYSTDGKTLLDELHIPVLQPDQSFGYYEDGVKYDHDGNALARVLERVTPSSNNQVIGENPKLVELRKNDSKGFTMTLTSMLVVFSGLLALFIVFFLLGRFMRKMSQNKSSNKGGEQAKAENRSHTVSSNSELSYEMLAAISAAVYEMNNDLHDAENTVLTFQDIKKHYSPWNSKIHTLRQLPRK